MNASSLSEKKAKPSNQPSSQPFPMVERTPIWMTISGTLLLVSLGAIILSFLKFGAPVKLGLDFVGGSKIEYKFSSPINKLTPGEVTQKVFNQIGPEFGADSLAQVSKSNGSTYLILRTKELNVDTREKLDSLLKSNFGQFEVLSVDTISGTIGPELLSSGLLALGITLAGILLFISYRFRRDFAVCAIIALCHDVVIVIGLFAILGLVINLEVNVLFLTACLTVFGFSIHDTIVVFDRIRENTKYLSKKRNLVQIINESIQQVWFRSICTSLTTLITLGTLLVWGGETTRIFAGAMFVGILTGTYSSIFVASALLGQWHLWQEKNKLPAKKN